MNRPGGVGCPVHGRRAARAPALRGGWCQPCRNLPALHVHIEWRADLHQLLLQLDSTHRIS
ncbi:MAG TPA: hypothetical protein VK464_14505 [Symbiobacteriaceae bacterium]|nr:hypothetical protein [Symbiobacteriaceae bacterium]